MNQWKEWKTALEAKGQNILIKVEINDGSIHIEDAEVYSVYDNPYHMLFDNREFNGEIIGWTNIPEDNEWKPWETSSEMAGKKVLVKFEMNDGNIHIEDAEIQIIDNHPYYILFDGETLNANIVGWTHIPE